IDLLLLLVNTITTDNELMSDYFEYLTRTLSEASRERNQLLSERRRAQEEESKQKKLQLQNGDNEKISSKKQSKLGPLITPKNSNGTTNDENRQSSPIVGDENGDIDNVNDDDLKTVLQRRRQMVAMSKELKEKRELEAQQLQIKQKRQLAIQKAEQIYRDAFLNVQYGFRIKPLGFDRNYNRYWFFRGYPGLFVEKAPPYVMACLCCCWGGFSSSRLNEHGFHIASFLLVGILGFIFMIILPDESKVERYASNCIAFCGLYPSFPLALAWLTKNIGGHTKRALAICYFMASSQLGGAMSFQIYREADKPSYRRGHLLCGGAAIMALIATLILRYCLIRENYRRAHLSADEYHREATIEEPCDWHPDIRYVL
ncbi:unnamed protein product, partial [Rotaria sp. Silwood2]